ncbi:MAG TPA: SusC/RagA family TonB-linked outer membrane protein [Cytophagales bacterium]|nr:SusC/RagA family TonB-linked outer membrane protein [Cytophagales bacterium]
MKKVLKFCGLLVLLCCLKFSVYSQALASSASLKSYPDSSGPVVQNENRSLKSILHYLEKKYDVSFFYKSELVENKSINISNIKDSSLEQELKSCLAPNGLKYEKIRDDFFVISPVKAEGISEIENKRSYTQTNEEQQLSTSISSMERLNSIYSNIVTVRELQIKGKVTGEDGLGLPGVSVVVKGSTVGTVTDAEGAYTLTVPDGTAVLVFSFIGYNTEEVAVNNRTIVDVKLIQDLVGLQEVVVTALGIKREEKTLGYAVTKVEGASLTKARETNVANSLVGKIAGVNVTPTAGGPGSSANVNIRGVNSFSGGQPLYVINGIPMNADNRGMAGTWGGADAGDGISNINPDDIETMTVLKGSTASALYGSRASNGVILITTKGGRGRKGIGVDFNSNYTFDRVMDLTDWQYEYGQGGSGVKPVDVNGALASGASSWGAKLDGSDVIQFDGVARPYVAQKDNIKNFYRNGYTFTNTLAFSAGDENGGIRLSASDLNNSSVVPNSSMRRNTFNLDINYNLTKKLLITGNTNITIDKAKNRPSLSDSPGNANFGVLFLPTSLDVTTLKPGYVSDPLDPNFGDEIMYTQNAFGTNPYFAVNRFINNTSRNRNISSLSLKYNFTDWLYLQGRVGRDYYSDEQTVVVPTGTAYRPAGDILELNTRFSEINADFLLGINRKITEDIGFGFTGGGSIMKRDRLIRSVDRAGFAVPFLYTIGNTLEPSDNHLTDTPYRKETQSFYYSIELSYKDFLFLNTTGRNDWFSTLNPSDNSLFYPSVSGSFVFSELVSTPILSFGKLRASWASTSGETDPFVTDLYYNVNGNLGGRPIGVNTNANIPNPLLTPYIMKEFEVGLDLRFLKNRIGLDVAYFNRRTNDEIVPITTSATSGYTGAFVNVGELSNSGFEFLLSASPIKTDNLSWTVSLNHTMLDNTVNKIIEGQDEYQVPGATARTQDAYIKHYVGLPASQIMAFDYKRDANGNIIYDVSGFPLRGDLKPYGSSFHNVYGGLNNEVNFKGINLSFLIDYKFGAKMFSATNSFAMRSGLHKNTLVGREGGVVGVGVNENGEPNTVNVAADQYYGQLAQRISSEFVYDASFIKLRQVVLGYTLPKSLFGSFPVQSINISFVARNLGILMKRTDNIDPEANINNSVGQGLELAGVPPVRSYGFNLSAKF